MSVCKPKWLNLFIFFSLPSFLSQLQPVEKHGSFSRVTVLYPLFEFFFGISICIGFGIGDTGPVFTRYQIDTILAVLHTPRFSDLRTFLHVCVHVFAHILEYAINLSLF